MSTVNWPSAARRRMSCRLRCCCYFCLLLLLVVVVAVLLLLLLFCCCCCCSVLVVIVVLCWSYVVRSVAAAVYRVVVWCFEHMDTVFGSLIDVLYFRSVVRFIFFTATSDVTIWQACIQFYTFYSFSFQFRFIFTLLVFTMFLCKHSFHFLAVDRF